MRGWLGVVECCLVRGSCAGSQGGVVVKGPLHVACAWVKRGICFRKKSIRDNVVHALFNHCFHRNDFNILCSSQ